MQIYHQAKCDQSLRRCLRLFNDQPRRSPPSIPGRLRRAGRRPRYGAQRVDPEPERHAKIARNRYESKPKQTGAACHYFQISRRGAQAPSVVSYWPRFNASRRRSQPARCPPAPTSAWRATTGRPCWSPSTTMLDTVVGPLNVAANTVEQISKGAIPPKITDTYNGDFNTLKTNLNQCIDGLGGLARGGRGCPKDGQQRPQQKGGWKLCRNLRRFSPRRQRRTATSPSRDFNHVRRRAGEPGGTCGV